MRNRPLLIGFLVLATGGLVYAHAGQARTAHPRSCYRTAPARLPGNRWPAAQRELAPAGAVGIRLCRYAGLNGHPRSKLLRSSLRTNPRLVAKLVRQFDELPSAPPGAEACPMDDGSQIIALLAYPHGRAVRIAVGLTGCRRVTNGDVVRTALGPQLVSQLKRLS